jgi:hypothetical protein
MPAWWVFSLGQEILPGKSIETCLVGSTGYPATKLLGKSAYGSMGCTPDIGTYELFSS